jgi:RNA polymerase primary sigma factor
MDSMRKIKQPTNYSDEGDTIKMYFRDLNGEKTISREEEAQLARRIKEQDYIALKKLVRANLKFVISVAKQYKNRNIPLIDLINEGNIGLIKAAHKFDETKGFKFISYAVWWIRQSILHAINNHSKIVRIPANIIGHYNQIKKVYLHFEQKYEREPYPEEIADLLDQKPAEVYKTLYNEVRDSSLDAPVGEEDETSIYETLENRSVDSTDYQLEYKQSLKHEIVRALNMLETRERDVIKMSFGIDQDHAMNFEEIGNKLNLTRERVRQIRKKAIEKLKSERTLRMLKEYCV